jgi:glycine oxidase
VIPDLEPHVSPEAPGGLFIPIHGFVGAASLTAAAVAAAADRGVEVVVESGAIEVRSTPGGGVAVSTSSRVWEADRVVMAAGSWSPRVRVEGADPIPVTPIRGQILQLNSKPGLLGRPIWGEAGYLVPWPDGSVLVGGTVEDVGFDESSTQEARRALLDMAVALVPALKEAEIADARAGLRPKSPDDLPLVGRSQVVPGLVYATGHYRNGVLLAPLTADLVRRLVMDPAAGTIAALDPARCGTF